MNHSISEPLTASCPCGSSHFDVTARPFARFICHCTICQAFTGKPYSDVVLLKQSEVRLPDGHRIVFRKYRPPPNIVRGNCPDCGKPVIEFGGFGPLATAFVPVGNLADTSLLPPPSMHIFYHRRIADAADGLPKYSGYFRSEMAIVGLLTRGTRSPK